jgi:hypothetical protein
MPTLSTLKRGGELLWSNHKLRISGRKKISIWHIDIFLGDIYRYFQTIFPVSRQPCHNFERYLRYFSLIRYCISICQNAVRPLLRIRGRTKEQQAKAANSRGREQRRGPESRRHAVEWQNKHGAPAPHPETFGVLGREWDAPSLAIGASGRGPRAAAANAARSDASCSAPAANQYRAAGSLHSLVSCLLRGKKSSASLSLSPAAPPALSLRICSPLSVLYGAMCIIGSKWKTLSPR